MNRTVDDYQVVYFTMRSVGAAKIGYILQIVAKFHGGETYSEWVKPPKSAEEFLGGIPGLKTENGELFYRYKKLPALPLKTALGRFFEFLKSSRKPVVLVGFSQRIILERLLQTFLRTDTVDAFYNVIAAFSDSYGLFEEEVTRLRGRTFFNIFHLAETFLGEEFVEKFLEASRRVEILEKLVIKCNLRDRIIEYSTSFKEAILSEMEIQYSAEIVHGLGPLRDNLTPGILKKLAEAKVSYATLQQVFLHAGSQALKKFLSEKQWNGTPRVTDKAEIQKKIIRNFVAGITSQHGQNEDQVDDETGELTQERSSGNSETGPSSSKRPAIFRRRKNPRSQKSCVLA